MSNAIVIDVSHWQGKINFKKVTALAVIMKASDGLSSKPDPMCAQYAKGFRDAGKKIGFYHFFQPGLDGARQADNFLNLVSKASPAGFDIAPVLDIEKNKGLPAATLETEVAGFVSEIQKQAKRDPLIY